MTRRGQPERDDDHLETADVAVLRRPEHCEVGGDADQSGEDSGRNQDGVEVELERRVEPHAHVGAQCDRFRIRHIDQTRQAVEESEAHGGENEGRLLRQADHDRIGDDVHQPSASCGPPSVGRPSDITTLGTDAPTAQRPDRNTNGIVAPAP